MRWRYLFLLTVGVAVFVTSVLLMVTDTPRTYEPQRWTPQTSGEPVETEVFP